MFSADHMVDFVRQSRIRWLEQAILAPAEGARLDQLAYGLGPIHCWAARIWRARALAIRRMCSNSVKCSNSDSCSGVSRSCFAKSSSSSARCCADGEGWKSTTACGVVPERRSPRFPDKRDCSPSATPLLYDYDP